MLNLSMVEELFKDFYIVFYSNKFDKGLFKLYVNNHILVVDILNPLLLILFVTKISIGNKNKSGNIFTELKRIGFRKIAIKYRFLKFYINL